MPKPVSLPVRCIRCDTALRLDVADWTPDLYAMRTTYDYICPECQMLQTVRLPGKLVSVARLAVS
jgi:hypothetical protein